MKEVWNRDVRPPADWSASAALAPLVRNERIARAFDQYESQAKAWKRAFHWAGLTASLGSVLGVALVGYQAVLAGFVPPLVWLQPIGLVVGAISLCATLFLLVLQPRDKWLTARLGAERLRCFKFQLFLQLAHGVTDKALAERLREAVDHTLARFGYQAGGGAATLEYRPDEDAPTIPSTSSDLSPRPAWLAEAKALYADMRINVQKQHFAARIRDRDAELRPARRLGDLVFATGLMLSAVQLIVEGWGPGGIGASPRWAAISAWLTFLSLVFFTASAALLLIERGRNVEVDRERYATYHALMSEQAEVLPDADLPAFLAIIARVERLCVNELADFIRDMRRNSYF